MVLANLSNADLYESTGGRENFSESLVTIEVKPSMLEVFSDSFLAIGSKTTGGIDKRSVASRNIAGSFIVY